MMRGSPEISLRQPTGYRDRAFAPTLRSLLSTHYPLPSALVNDPHAALRDQVLQQVLSGPGESDPAVRRAAADKKGVPADLQSLIEKVHAHAYRVTDADVAKAQATYGDDKLFEIIVSAALGASRKRLVAGLNALASTEVNR